MLRVVIYSIVCCNVFYRKKQLPSLVNELCLAPAAKNTSHENSKPSSSYQVNVDKLKSKIQNSQIKRKRKERTVNRQPSENREVLTHTLGHTHYIRGERRGIELRQTDTHIKHNKKTGNFDLCQAMVVVTSQTPPAKPRLPPPRYVDKYFLGSIKKGYTTNEG